MPRYILIDRESGYIFADTAALHGFCASSGTPADAARALDADLKNEPAAYEETHNRDLFAIYDVYRADVRGSEAVPVVQDGQSQEIIEAVTRDCDFVTSLKRAAAE